MSSQLHCTVQSKQKNNSCKCWQCSTTDTDYYCITDTVRTLKIPYSAWLCKELKNYVSVDDHWFSNHCKILQFKVSGPRDFYNI